MILHIKKRRIFVVLIIFSISILSETITAQITPNATNKATKSDIEIPYRTGIKQINKKKFVIVDSLFTPWIPIHKLSEKYYYSNFKSDTAGNIYCVADLKEDYSKKQLIKFTNNHPDSLEVFETGIENKNYMSLQQDGQGNLYVKSDDGLYRLGGNKWEKVFSLEKGVPSYTPIPKSDGGLYTFITEITDKNKEYIVNKNIAKYENGVMKHLGKNGKPLHLNNLDDWFVVGRDGSIYSYYSHPSHSVSTSTTTNVYRWNGMKWENIGIMPAKITYIDFDNNNILYAAGSNNQNDWFFKKWDGTIWSDVPLPNGLNKESYHPIFDEDKNVFMVGKKDITSILYKRVNDQWVEQARDKTGLFSYFSGGEFLPVNGKIYSVGRLIKSNTKSEYIFRYEQQPQWVVTEKEAVPIPVLGPILSKSDSLSLSSYYIFELNGLKGILTSSGTQIVKAIFNDIYISFNPGNLCTNENYSDNVKIYKSNYILTMRKGSDIIYVELPNYNNILNKFVYSTCPTCNGSGKTGGGERTREIKGEYVKEETTQIKKLGLNGWYWETTKTPGYYKTGKTVKESVPISTCSCKLPQK